MATDIKAWLDFAIQQMAAESYLDQFTGQGVSLQQVLVDGNNDRRVISIDQFTGKTQFTDLQSQQFAQRYQVVDHHANDATGFSATLMKDTQTGEYTLSFRSTEFLPRIQGGDWERDGLPGADGEIFDQGFALAQLVSMERYYRELTANPLLMLPAGARLNVTGYSLGGHLATIFTELHYQDPNIQFGQTTTFNGAGRGRIVEQGQDGQPEVQSIRRMLLDLETRILAFDPTGSRFQSGASGNIYAEQAYDEARAAMHTQFVTFGTLSIGSTGVGETRTGGAFDKITQLIGKGLTGTDVSFVVNSGIHAPSISVLIEGQPQIEGQNEQGQLQIGNTHSITLLVDSLAVQALFERLDPDLIQTDIEHILQASSNARADTFTTTADEHVAEGDTLERALDALRALVVPTAIDKKTDFNDDTGGFGNLLTRTEFYSHLAEVQAATANQTFSIEPLVHRDAQGRVAPRLTGAELVAAAQDSGDSGLAYRYALRALNPFAVVGADYFGLGHTAEGQLSLYDSATGFGELTAQYLTDRAAFLLGKLDLTLHNFPAPVTPSLTHYADVTTGTDVPSTSPPFQREYLFGGLGADTLHGSRLLPTNDHLYGGGGNDSLLGDGGDDYLQGDSGDDRLDAGTGGDTLVGGLGFDTYVLNPDGTDTIEDGDGRGMVQVNNQSLVGGVRKAGEADHTYKSLDGQFTFVQSGSTLTINNTLTIQNWDPGDLGITLRNLSSLPTGTPPTIDYTNGLPTHFTDVSTATVSFDIGPIGGAGLGFNEIVYTGSGNDDIFAHPLSLGNHQFRGGAGHDFLEGALGHDRLYGEAGQDWLVGGDAGDDVLDGGEDRDVLIARAGQDHLLGGSGDDLLQAGAGRDWLDGGAGNDTLLASSTNAFEEEADYLDGGDDNDFLWGGQGDDVLLGGAGDDRLRGDSLVDAYTNLGWAPAGQFLVLPPEVQFRPAGGADYLDGGAGNDTLYGDGGDDVLLGGIGLDTLYGDDETLDGEQAGADLLDGGAGNDQLFGGGGSDRLLGGADNDVLVGDFLNDPVGANDWLDGGSGNDTLAGGRGDDVLVGGAGRDTLLGHEGEDMLDGGIGNDNLQGGVGVDVLWGGAGNDQLAGDEGNDQLFGEAGADTLTGGDGDDVLIGGAGIDTLIGGLGADTYVFNLGDGLSDGTGEGVESIQDTPGEGNKIVFGPGIHAEAIHMGIGSLVIRVGLTNDAIHIQGFDPATPTVSVGIDTFEFADGTILTQADLIAKGFDLVGTAGDDALDGGDLYRGIYGLAGNDVLTGGAIDNVLNGGDGNDHLLGGSGTDALYGGSGSDVVFGEGGNDQLFGEADADVMRGGDGDDVLSGDAGDDSLEGEAGADVLAGGIGDDQLLGGAGSDTYRFNLGDGFDSVFDSGPGSDTDTVVFGSGITPNSVVLSTSFGQIVIKVGVGSDGIRSGSVVDVFGSQTIEQFRFADGTSLTYADLVARGFLIEGTEFADTLTGTSLADRLQGGLGNDRLEGLNGNDSYFFNVGDGLDTIMDSASVGAGNEIVFGAGITSTDLRLDLTPDQSHPNLSDLLIRVGTNGDAIHLDMFDRNNVLGVRTVETVRFADGSTLSYEQLLARGFDLTGTEGDDDVRGTNVTDRITVGGGADVLRGELGDDMLDGGMGNDRLLGGQGNDRYVFSPGSGQDVIQEFAGAFDELRFVAGIIPSQVTARRDGGDLVIDVNGGSDRVTIAHFFDSPVFQVEQVQFADGTVWNQTQLLTSGQRTFNGTNDADVMQGGSTDDQLNGFDGDDTLIGLAGQDVLDGGPGADSMTGELGDDRYVVDQTGDVVAELPDEGLDTVESTITYTLGVNVENLTLTGSIAIDGTGNAGNNVLTGNSAANVLTGGAGNDTYVIGTGDTVVELSGEGNDTVIADQTGQLGANVENLTLTGSANLNGTGNELDNVLTGNSGANVLTGGAGNDTYVISAGDTVVEDVSQGIDTVVTDHSYTLGTNIENVMLTGNTSLVATGNAFDNRLQGNGSASVLRGGLGDDTYVVLELDLVVESVGQGVDTVLTAQNYTLGANVENLTLLDTFPTLEVGLTQGTGQTERVGPSNSYSGVGNALSNLLVGNRGDNLLEGRGGNDVLDGRQGMDILKGGAGADTYLFGLGYGQDGIDDESLGGESDTIQLSAGILPTQVGVVQSDGDLVLRMPGSQDELRLLGFFVSSAHAQKTVRFEDGTVWDGAMLRALGADPGQGITIIDADRGDNVLRGGIGHDVLTGGDGNDTLIGNGGNDILRDLAGNNMYDGGSGDDSLIGSGGNDIFMFGRRYGRDVIHVDQLFNDIVITDTDQVQMVGLNPSDVIIIQAASSLSFTITVLDTADQLIVQFRNDTYQFAPAPVTLNFADGTSQELGFGTTFPTAPSPAVFSSVDYALGINEANLVLVDSNSSVVPNARVGIGNGLDNVILGNTADNVLEGGPGNDVLSGGFARSVESVAFIDTGSDILLGGEGDDVLLASGNVAFPFDFGIGTDPNPFNTPDDILIGGPGNDTYYIQHAGQTVTEVLGEGVDTIKSTVSYTLGEDVENLILIDPTHVFDNNEDLVPSPPLHGTGNELDNLLIGSAKANTLTGGAGHDTLWGGNAIDPESGAPASGNDTLVGGEGFDTYLFNLGDGVDIIEDRATVGEGNRIQFGTGIGQGDLTFTHDETTRTLTIQVGSSGADRLILMSFDPTNANGSLVVETMAFADGSQASLVALLGGVPNQTPTVANPIADPTVPEGTPINFAIPANTFSDPDAGDSLTYSASLADGTALPTWLSFDPVTRTFSGTPDDAQVGSLALRVTATDTGSLSASDVFTLTVQNVNEAPTMATPLANQATLEDALFSFTVPASTFTDVDQSHGDTLTYSATQVGGAPLPAWLTFDPATRTLSGTSGNGDVGTSALTVTVTDSGSLSASTTFNLSVQNVNDAPILANPIADQTTSTGAAFTFTVAANTFADVDAGDSFAYSATRADGTALPSWFTFTPTTRTFSGTPADSDAGLLTIQVTALDSGSLSVADLFDLTLTVPDRMLTGTDGNDILAGDAGHDQLFGLAGNDTLNGGAGNDLLDGGTGSDTMMGGTGNDTYVVDAAGDVVTDLANEGADTVQSSITYTLGSNLENLTLTGTAAINGAGNGLNNILIGNSANNTLNGGAGNDRLDGGLGSDTMVGGTGNDTYVVNQVGDVVSETAGQGTDTVESSITFTLGSNVESLVLTGTANINGIGGSANNILVGNSGNNTLSGGSGDDAADGGPGNDALSGGSGNDVLVGGDGVDTLDGGSGDDQLLGGAGNDTMTGGSGGDQFVGGSGNDLMTGGSGNDIYQFSRGDGQDTISDSDPFVGNQDRAIFGATINPLDLAISRQANDLRLAIHGSTDRITLQNWYLGTNNQIETIEAGNGQTLLSSQVDQLIQAMAQFTQQTGLTWDQGIDQRPQDVQVVLAANGWT